MNSEQQFLESIGIDSDEVCQHDDLEDDFLWLQFDPRAQRIDRANIATDMVPLVNDDLKHGSSIRITGYDGTSLADEDYPWFAELCKWIDRGCNIEYLMINPSDDARDRMLALEEHGKESGGSFHGYEIQPESVTNGFEKSLIERWTTLHFVLFGGDGPRQMWIEGNHQPCSRQAEDCYYYDKELASNSGIYEILDSHFSHVICTFANRVSNKKEAPSQELPSCC